MLLCRLQAEADAEPIVNGRDGSTDVTDASTARGGNEASQTQSRQAASTSAASASLTGKPMCNIISAFVSCLSLPPNGKGKHTYTLI